MDGKETGTQFAPTSPQDEPGIQKYRRTEKTVIAHEGGCGLFLSKKERR